MGDDHNLNEGNTMLEVCPWASIDRERAQSLFPPPPPPSPGPASSSSPPRSEARSKSPKKRGVFSCLCRQGDADYDEDSGAQDIDFTPVPTWSSELGCPKIENFSERIAGCRVRGGISMDLLTADDELFQNFVKWMEEERAAENIHCWLAFRDLVKECQAESFDAVLQHINDLNVKFFLPSSTSQVGCCELYEPMKDLVELCQANPFDHDTISITVSSLKQNVEIIGLKDGLSRWQMYQVEG